RRCHQSRSFLPKKHLHPHLHFWNSQIGSASVSANAGHGDSLAPSGKTLYSRERRCVSVTHAQAPTRQKKPRWFLSLCHGLPSVNCPSPPVLLDDDLAWHFLAMEPEVRPCIRRRCCA